MRGDDQTNPPEAIEWAQEAFRTAGGENVHAEKFTIPFDLEDTMKLVGVWPAWESGQRGRSR